MKITKNTLNKLIREELEKLVADEPIPVKLEDFTWNGEKLNLWSAHGFDYYSVVETGEGFERWKTVVLSHGEGSTIILDDRGRWVPAAGPWKEKTDGERGTNWGDRLRSKRGLN